MTPSTLEEAVSAIRATFPASELDERAAQPAHIALIHAHFGFGMWIRNQWVHGSGSPLADKIQKRLLLGHDDSVSSTICQALWLVLNGQPCPSVEELIPAGDSD